jgi:hypothetical protein
MNISTQNLLIQYAYGETEILETVLAQNLIDSDPCIQSDFKDIVQLIETIDSVMVEPSDTIISQIMAKA